MDFDGGPLLANVEPLVTASGEFSHPEPSEPIWRATALAEPKPRRIPDRLAPFVQSSEGQPAHRLRPEPSVPTAVSAMPAEGAR